MQCIVIGPVCGFVYVCVFVLWVCYHDNSKLRASILTKLGLQVKAVTISSWLNFGHPMPPGRGLHHGEKFWLRLTTASVQCLRLCALFHWYLWCCEAYFWPSLVIPCYLWVIFLRVLTGHVMQFHHQNDIHLGFRLTNGNPNIGCHFNHCINGLFVSE